MNQKKTDLSPQGPPGVYSFPFAPQKIREAVTKYRPRR